MHRVVARLLRGAGRSGRTRRSSSRPAADARPRASRSRGPSLVERARAGSSRRARRSSRSGDRARARPSGCLKSSVTLSLLRLMLRKYALSPSRNGGPRRACRRRLPRLFDLDDARAHVGEQHRAVRPREHARQVEDGDSVERTRHLLDYTGFSDSMTLCSRSRTSRQNSRRRFPDGRGRRRARRASRSSRHRQRVFHRPVSRHQRRVREVRPRDRPPGAVDRRAAAHRVGRPRDGVQGSRRRRTSGRTASRRAGHGSHPVVLVRYDDARGVLRVAVGGDRPHRPAADRSRVGEGRARRRRRPAVSVGQRLRSVALQLSAGPRRPSGSAARGRPAPIRRTRSGCAT